VTEVDDTELADLRAKADAGDSAAAALDETQKLLATATEANVAATTEFLAQARAANADIPPDAIAGDTIAAVKASATVARQVADAVKASSANATPDPSTTPPPTTIPSQAAAPARDNDAVPEGTRGAARIAVGLARMKE
jgi:hypothetical protein